MLRKAFALIVLVVALSGCTISLDRADRQRVDKFLAEVERFNDNVEAVLRPEKPKKVSRPLASNE